MSGLNLRGAGGVGNTAADSSFTAVPASPPSMSGTTATQQAYGTAPAGSQGPSTARNGTIIAGVAGTLVILFMWNSLPR